MSSGNILVVDNDSLFVEGIRRILESAGFSVTSALRKQQAIETLGQKTFDVVIVDVQIALQNGGFFTDDVPGNAGLQVIVLTGNEDIAIAAQAMHKGAFSYLIKPFQKHALLMQIENAFRVRELTAKIESLKGMLGRKHTFADIVSRSKAMEKVLRDVIAVAGTDATISIRGERGAGKELIARTIHSASLRKNEEFITINCSAIPDTHMETELFGCRKDSFSQTCMNHDGVFQKAAKGTVYFDEIGALPLYLQAKLLRVLEERACYPVGGNMPLRVDARVIAGTSKNLEEEMRVGRFRSDLFFRIHIVPICVPPLRARTEDIPVLATHFLEKFGRARNKDIKRFSPGAMKKLMHHEWPGNVRELKNIIEYAVASAECDTIPEDLIIFEIREPEHRPLKPFDEAKANFEKEYVIELLKLTKGNITKAGEIAGKHRTNLYILINKYHISPSDFR